MESKTAIAREPGKPYGLKISDISKNGIEFYWKKLVDADGYEVYRSYNREGPFEMIREIPRRNIGTYLDKSFDHSRRIVFYTVRSFVKNANGEKSFSVMAPPVAARYVKSLKLEREKTYLYDGTARKIKAVYGWGEPDDLVWSTSDESIASVDKNGTITGIAGGECRLICKSIETSMQAEGSIIVNRPAEPVLHRFPQRFQKNRRTGFWENREKARTDQAVIVMVGDLMCGKMQMSTQRNGENGWDFCDSFVYVRELTGESDLAVANLETLLAPGWPYMTDETYIDNYNNCNATSRYLESVRYGGFDAVVMANNHNCDGGVRALLETIDQVERYDYAHTGIFRSTEEERFFIADVNGIKVGFLSYMSRATGFNGKDRTWSDEEKGIHLNLFSKDKVYGDIQRCKEKGAEYVIVYMHWGEKHFRLPTEMQYKEAREAAEAGADYIVGANPHVLQEYDELLTSDERRVPCFYSLGNFQSIMNQVEGNRESVMVRIRLERDAFGKIHLMENGYIPCYIYRKIENSNWAPAAVCYGYHDGLERPDKDKHYQAITGTIGDKISPVNVYKGNPSLAVIRLTMEKTGWGAYDSYCRILYLAYRRNVSFEEVAADELWKDYKYHEVLDDLQRDSSRQGFLYQKGTFPFLDKQEFAQYFYTDRQLASMEHIQHGQMTLKDLFDYMKIKRQEIPGIDLSDDISDRLAFTLAGVKPGGIFICTRRKDIVIDRIERKKPACIISYPRYQKLLSAAGGVCISRSYLLSYLLDLAEMWKANYKGKTLAVSGSIGKTTTTEMAGHVVGATLEMFKITGNQNTTNQIAGFVFHLPESTQIYVQECSGSFQSQLESSTRILHPDLYILTNIGNGHIGKYGGRQELLLYEKLALDRNAADGATGIINWDDPLLKKVRYHHRIIRYAVTDTDADIIAENIEEENGTITFDIVENNHEKRRTSSTLNVCGIHNVYNALGVFAAGLQLGIPRQSIMEALKNYKPKSVRQNLVWMNGQRLYMDCYSATVESMETAMRVIQTINVADGEKKIAVLSDVPDLGEETEAKHREIGRMVAQVNSADEVIFYGSCMKYAMEEALGGHVCCSHTNDEAELEEMIRQKSSPSGLIVFKASHKMALQKVIDDLYGTNFYCYDELTANAKIGSKDGMQYRFIDQYGCILERMTAEDHEIVLPDSVDQYDVRVIGKDAFSKTRIRGISLPGQLTCVSENAFSGCETLSRIEFPASLKYIAEGAFSGCDSLEELDLSAGCSTIADFAFQGCKRLRAVYLPANLKSIGDQAFEEGIQAEVYCPAGSPAAEWAKGKGLQVIER